MSDEATARYRRRVLADADRLDPILFDLAKGVNYLAATERLDEQERLANLVATTREAIMGLREFERNLARAFPEATSNVAPVTRKCEQCREPFEAARSDARYCSTRCRVRAHRSRT